MCSDNYQAKTTEQVVMDTRARLERIHRELPRKSPRKLPRKIELKTVDLFESIHGVNW